MTPLRVFYHCTKRQRYRETQPKSFLKFFSCEVERAPPGRLHILYIFYSLKMSLYCLYKGSISLSSM